MKAVVFPAANALEVRDVPAPSAAAREVVVSLRAAALNHRDEWIHIGKYAGLHYPCIPGSDGAGVVTAVGTGVDASWLGREVIINPSFNWGDRVEAQGDAFGILGLPRAGTLAEQIAVPVEQVSPKPAHLTWEEASALPLAGLTAYRALFTRARLGPRDRVLISGIGGGVAVFALQFARAVGAEVWVTSSSEQKIERARALGARGGYLYTQQDWAKSAQTETGGFDVIVDSAGGPGFEAVLDAAASGGRVVFYGATRGDPTVLPMRKVFWRQLSLLGTTMGSPEDWSGLLRLVGQHSVRPVVGMTFPLAQAHLAFDRMARGEQFGKIVLQLG